MLNNVYCAADNKNRTPLTQLDLDLSAAFNTIEQDILIR
jgi:hypothetical protein